MITKSITPFIVKINNLIIKNYYKKLVKKLSIKTHILWLYNPFHQLLIDVCNQKLVCYYVYDELAEYPKNNKIKFILNKYDTILSKKSDIIFASSLSQVDKRKTLNKNIYLIENAVDFDRFYTVFKTITEMPKDLKNIKKPIIGYAGYLGFQINVELLLLIANNFPDCSLVLVGPNDLEKDNIYKNLIKCDNVYFLGSKYVDEIPKYVKMFDVAIMPYALNTHVLTSFPLKTYEYLSMGKLVVSVKLNSLIPLNDLVFLAEDNEIFILKIREIISHSSEILKEKIEKGIAVSKNNTWDIRVQQIYEVIQNKLK
jgi:glycosyltransferase involved in cell wall biosynthesis